MASISSLKDGEKRIQFVAPDGSRKTIYLGKVAMKVAETVKIRVEHLIAARAAGVALDAQTAGWLAGLPDAMHVKLAGVGLIEAREAIKVVMLGVFLDRLITGRSDVKPASKTVWDQVRRNLVEFFGAEHDVRLIGPADADEFKQHLIREKLAATTVSKRLQHTRMFFAVMLRRRLIDANPFSDVKHAASGTKDRQRFVTREEITKVIKCCPNHHWRMIVALARFAGLRTPSETLSLKWQDIDWERQRILVTSPKTEHHQGKESRLIPLFAELRPFLEESFELAPEGSVYVVDERFRKSADGPLGWKSSNLRTTFEKIINRAGLKPWPRLFHNLRASRESELVEQFPVQVVTAWLGNTPRIALQHYLMVQETHFEKAVGQATHIPTQYRAETPRNDSQATTSDIPELAALPRVASRRKSMHNKKMEGTGFEPV